MRNSAHRFRMPGLAAWAPRTVAFLAAVASALAAAANPRPVAAETLTAERSVYLSTVTFSGHRYVVMADLRLPNRVPLMVHGNARVYLSLTHKVAARIHGGPVTKIDDYGYSSAGRGAIDVPVMRLGGQVFDSIAAVPVFDFSQGADPPFQGMLGVRFLTSARAAVDFTKDALLLGVAVAGYPNARLLEQGYKYVRMRIGDDYSVTIDAYFPDVGRVVAITPSTVSSALTLHQPLFAGKVAMKKAIVPDKSPNGTSPDEYTSDGVSFEVAGVACRNAASFEDLAEYAKVSEAKLGSFGMLGYDWMKQHRAILDYANRILYFKP